MLQAVQHKTSWSVIKDREDTLTSSVFERLLYLPAELMWQILQEAVYDRSLPVSCGPIEDAEFWPKWDASNTDNARFVEPDLFVRFANMDLIVEAKRSDEGGQRRKQWEDEIKGYLNENPRSERPLLFLAVGGFQGTSTDPVIIGEKAFPVILCHWRRLLAACKAALQQLQRCSVAINANTANRQVLKDILVAFSLHGYATGAWLAEVDLSPWHARSQSAQVLHFVQK